MRIGLLPCLNDSRGGVYQYSLTLLKSLWILEQEGLDEEFLLFITEKNRSTNLISAHWPQRFLFEERSIPNKILDILDRVIGEGIHRKTWRWLRDRIQPGWRLPNSILSNLNKVNYQHHLKQRLLNYDVNMMVYPAPTALSFEIGIPYIMAIHDLQHRLHPDFPEVSANGEWARREYLFRNGSRFATLLISDSEIGKEDILYLYGLNGITPDRIKVLPFLPPHCFIRDVDEAQYRYVLKTYKLTQSYLFYPAQFWPHKNHARIIEALSLLKNEQNLQIHVVFVGSYEGELRRQTFQKMMKLAQQRRVINQVRYLGYVPEQNMAALYACSRGLIMPTFFGPTNIPPLEAWFFGCPVITSDIRGIREQMGDAAVLINPNSVESIADGISRVWNNESLRQKLIARGKARLASYSPADYRQRLKSIITEAKERIQA